MDEHEWLAERFQQHRPRLRAVAFRMLGSVSEADDAVQETWLRLSGAKPDEIDNLEAWLVTVVGRVALNLLRSRTTRREEPLDTRLPDPVVEPLWGMDPEHEATLADSVGLALLVVLERLPPAERLAFVLHDLFSVPFEDVGTILNRSPEAARQLASRGRRRLREAEPSRATSVSEHRDLVRAFLAAARGGDFDTLLTVLDPDVVVRQDGGTGRVVETRGAETVARQAHSVAALGLEVKLALVNGAPGFVSYRDGTPFVVAAVTVRNGRITELAFLHDPARLARLDLERL